MQGEGAGFAIFGDGELATHRYFPAFLDSDVVGVVVDAFYRAHGVGVACDGIIFAIELARPLAVGGLALGIDAIDGAFDAVASGLVDDGDAFWNSGSVPRLGLVNFPRAHHGILGEAKGKAEHAHHDRNYDRSKFHLSLLVREFRIILRLSAARHGRGFVGGCQG
jgi:hypothetical protein